MVVEVIEKNIRGGDRLKTLSQRETFWIDILQATHPPGLNEDIDFSVFLWIALHVSNLYMVDKSKGK